MRQTAQLVALVLLLASHVALGDGSPGSGPAEPATVVQARARFVAGAELVKRAQWAEAMTSFEASAALRPHPITTYNIAACERAMGRYTRARAAFERALAEDRAAGGALLPGELRTEIQGGLEQIEALLPRVGMTVEPADALMVVDGRPLARAPGAGSPVLVAGLAAPGRGEHAPGEFLLVLDPGRHVFTFARKGFTDAVVNRDFAPGARATLEVRLDCLPATLHIAADHAAALVTVGDIDVGPVPVDVLRPAGTWRVRVRSAGHLSYDTLVKVQAGESLDLHASLPLEKPSIVRAWWFWTALGTGVAAAGLGAYFIAGGPERPALDGGGLGWTLKVP